MQLPPIIGGLITILSQQLRISVWDGEVPRTDDSGNPIKPGATQVPTGWPAVKLFMEGRMGVKFTMTYAVKLEGPVLVQVWATSRTDAENLASQIATFFADTTNWALIELPGGTINDVNYVIDMTLTEWGSYQDEGGAGANRTSKGEILYKNDLLYRARVHTAASDDGGDIT